MFQNALQERMSVKIKVKRHYVLTVDYQLYLLQDKMYIICRNV